LNESSYLIMIKAYGKLYKLDKCFEMLKEINKKGIVPTSITYESIIIACIRCKKLELAEKIADEMKFRKIQIRDYITAMLINGYKTARNFDKAMKTFEKLLKNNEKPVSIDLYNSAFECCVEADNITKMEEIYGFLTTNNISPDLISYSILLKGYANKDNLEKVNELYNIIKSSNYKLDEVLYNTLLDFFAKRKDEHNLNSIYQDMKKHEIKVGLISYGMLLKLYSNINSLKGVELYDDLLKNGIKPNEAMFKYGIKLYLFGGFIDKAINQFRKLSNANYVIEKELFDTMISQCMEKKKDKESFEFALLALKLGFKSSDELYNTLIENLLASDKVKTQEKFDFLNRMNKEAKFKSIKIKQDFLDKASSFIVANKVIKPSIYTCNSIYSGKLVNNDLNGQSNKPIANKVENVEDPEKKKKKKKKKKNNENKEENKNEIQQKGINNNTPNNKKCI